MGGFKSLKRSIATVSQALTAVKAHFRKAVACGAPPSDGEPSSARHLTIMNACYV
jgi:hypothetical protein